MDQVDSLAPSGCDYGAPGERICRQSFFAPEFCCGNREKIGIRDRFNDPEMST